MIFKGNIIFTSPGVGELKNLVVENLAANPVDTVEGHLYFNTTAKEFRYYNGSMWSTFGGGSVTSRIQDGDNDCFVDVETTADADNIVAQAGPNGGQINMYTVDVTGIDSGAMSFTTGNSDNSASGDIDFECGFTVTGTGGAITLNGGDSDSGIGGNVRLFAGDSNSSLGGNVFIRSGDAPNGTAGVVQLQGGSSNDAPGGQIRIIGGEGDPDPLQANILIQGGEATQITDEGGLAPYILIKGSNVTAPGTELTGGDVIIETGSADAMGGSIILRTTTGINGGEIPQQNNQVRLESVSDFQTELRFVSYNESDYEFGFVHPGVQGTADEILKLPYTHGTSGQLLSTDGNNQLEWVDSAGLPTSTEEAYILVADNEGNWDQRSMMELPTPQNLAALLFGNPASGSDTTFFRYNAANKMVVLDYGHQLHIGSVPTVESSQVVIEHYVSGAVDRTETFGVDVTTGLKDLDMGFVTTTPSFVSVDVGDRLDVKIGTADNTGLEDVSLTLRAFTLPAVPVGTGSVTFHQDEILEATPITLNHGNALAFPTPGDFLVSGSITHAEWAVLAWANDVTPGSEDWVTLGHQTETRNLTINGTTLSSPSDYLVMSYDELLSPITISTNGVTARGYWYLVRLTVFGTFGIETDYVFIQPGE